MRFVTIACAAFLFGCSSSDDPGTPAEDSSTGGDVVIDETGDVATDTGPSCGESAWTTYGHDPRRTFASDGCVSGPLTQSWHYDPEPPMGRMLSSVRRAVAQKDAIYLAWSATAPPYLGTSAADRIDTSGKRVWTFDSGTDANFGNWLSIWNSYVVLNEDGVFMLNASDGKNAHGTGVDWWGQTIPDGTRLQFVNTVKADGPGLMVGALDDMAKIVWKQNEHDGCGNGFGDVMGGIALDAGTLFYAPLYQKGGGMDPGFPSGVFAFDAAAGTPKWNQTTKPRSAISAGDGRVYVVEEMNTLVARNQSDGMIAWKKDFSPQQVGSQAPVLASGLAIVATTDGIVALHADKGDVAWKASSIQAAQIAYASIINNGCGGSVAYGGAYVTSMAAALGSGTLVVTANDGIHVLSLEDGSEKSKLALDGGLMFVHDPIVVGKNVYVVDSKGVLALSSP